MPRLVPASPSGPAVALAFQRAAAIVLGIAWVSLGVQLKTLIGGRGLIPARDTLAALKAAHVTFMEAPTLLIWLCPEVHDATLMAGVLVGVMLCACAGLGLWPRACFLSCGALYLSYIVVGEDFLAFQWDNLFVETCALLAFLPRYRPAPLCHLAFRCLLFKLYFESGIAKWQSHLGDWHDGSAMTFYFETAPLPARLAFYAHQLPDAVHHLASWAALALELPLPFLIFGPRRARLLAFAAFTGFQVLNTATANYGFFTYLSLSLHLFLLDDADLYRWRARWFRIPLGPFRASAHERLLGGALFVGYLGGSLAVGVAHLGGPGPLRDALTPLARSLSPLRVTNAYHLFGHITRERVEPELQVQVAGAWEPLVLHYKPGPPGRPLPYVAPHQPRVDFRLWFYGLSFRRGMPRYVATLLSRICSDPRAVAPLFVRGPPPAEAVRVAFFRYHFASLSAHRTSGVYWQRTPLSHTRAHRCLQARRIQGETGE